MMQTVMSLNLLCHVIAFACILCFGNALIFYGEWVAILYKLLLYFLHVILILRSCSVMCVFMMMI